MSKFHAQLAPYALTQDDWVAIELIASVLKHFNNVTQLFSAHNNVGNDSHRQAYAHELRLCQRQQV